jgi:hypothetical protein
MATIFYEWIAVFCISVLNPAVLHEKKDMVHPLFISVTEIEHNAKEKTLEISCKIFTDDFEKTLRKHYSGKVDLLDEKIKAPMNIMVNDYIQKHLVVNADGKKVNPQFIGFEQQEEGIISYFQVDAVAGVKNIRVFDDLLYDYNVQQMGIIHVTVNGSRKSTRLNKPDANASFTF